MNDAVDIAITKRVIRKMSLPKDRVVGDIQSIRRTSERAINFIRPVSPNRTCRKLLEEYFIERSATENECLQAWALYLDYQSMAQLYGLRKDASGSTRGGGGFALAKQG